VIVGQVDTRRNLLFPLTIRGFTGQELAITALLDTGFSDWLSLTNEQVVTLGLLPSGVAESELADGSIVPVTLYTAIVVWEGIERLIEIVGGDTDPLLGIKLLEGYRLVADFADNGTLQLTRLPLAIP
jgi:clan AA aspartic protease